jgi:hypothetical protein
MPKHRALRTTVFAIGFLASACARPILLTSKPKRTSSTLVCDRFPNPELSRALSSKGREIEVASMWDRRCARAALIDSALSEACVTNRASCAVPEFVNGTRLADPAGRFDFVVVLLHLRFAHHQEKEEYERVCPRGRRGEGGPDSKCTGVRVVTLEDPEQGGPVFLLNARTGEIVAARSVRSASLSQLVDLIEDLVQ